MEAGEWEDRGWVDEKVERWEGGKVGWYDERTGLLEMEMEMEPFCFAEGSRVEIFWRRGGWEG